MFKEQNGIFMVLGRGSSQKDSLITQLRASVLSPTKIGFEEQ